MVSTLKFGNFRFDAEESDGCTSNWATLRDMAKDNFEAGTPSFEFKVITMATATATAQHEEVWVGGFAHAATINTQFVDGALNEARANKRQKCRKGAAGGSGALYAILTRREVLERFMVAKPEQATVRAAQGKRATTLCTKPVVFGRWSMIESALFPVPCGARHTT